MNLALFVLGLLAGLAFAQLIAPACRRACCLSERIAHPKETPPSTPAPGCGPSCGCRRPQSTWRPGSQV